MTATRATRTTARVLTHEAWQAPSALSGSEQDLADVAALLELAVRRGGVGERVPGVDDRTDPTLLHQGPDVLAHGRDDGGLLVRRSGPQRGRDHGAALAEQEAEVELRLRAALQADHDEPAAGSEGLDVAGEVLRAHVVEDDVGTGAAGGSPHLLDEVLLAVVDQDLGAE